MCQDRMRIISGVGPHTVTPTHACVPITTVRLSESPDSPRMANLTPKSRQMTLICLGPRVTTSQFAFPLVQTMHASLLSSRCSSNEATTSPPASIAIDCPRRTRQATIPHQRSFSSSRRTSKTPRSASKHASSLPLVTTTLALLRCTHQKPPSLDTSDDLHTIEQLISSLHNRLGNIPEA
ncbi:hypothetical protein Scep_025775 [Stephania cephalantha]|uniref:Uncharacterized protein n=1 Tax=Stephania cephalantha TaxID=152367 RepID=A0AAP0HRW1_9MAGN